MKTVSDSKRAFLAAHPHPINSVYRRVIEELLVEMHLLSVNADFKPDPIYYLGIVTSFERLMQGYQPEADKEQIFSKIGVFFPNQEDRGTHVNISGGGVTANAPNRENAIAFLEYLASPEAQQFFAVDNNEYPAVEGTPLSDIVASFGEFKEDTVNVSAYGSNNAEAVKIMDRSGWK